MSPVRVILLGYVLLSAACADDDAAIVGIPSLPSLPPVPERYAEPAAGDVRLSIEGIAFRTSGGADVRMAAVEAILAGAVDRGVPGEVAGGGAVGGSAAAAGGPQVHFRSLHIRSPGVRLPPAESRTGSSGAAPPGDGLGVAVLERDALDALFTPVAARGIRVDTLVLTRGEFARRSADGGWEWRAEDVDLALRDVRFGRWTSGAEGLRLVSASADIRTGERRSIVRGGTGRLVRSETEAEAAASFDINGSTVAGSAEARRGVEWSAELRTDRLDLATIHPILPRLPADGSARGLLRVRSAADGTEYVFDDFELSTPRSRIFADGGAWVAPPLQRPIVSADDLLLRLDPVGSEDLDAILGVSLPGGGNLRGAIRADGSGSSAEGIAVNADFTHEDSSGAVSRVALEGRAGQRPATWLNFELVGRPIRAADTAFAVELNAEGSLDSLALRGQALVWTGAEQRPAGELEDELEGVARVLASVPDLRLRLDADLLRRGEDSPRLVGEAEIVGPAELVTDTAADGGIIFRAAADPGRDRIWARAEGAVALSGEGEVTVGIVADSLPLGLLPPSGPIEQPSGYAHAEVEVGGSIDDPRFRGGVSLRDVGFVISELNMPVDSLTGEVRFRDRQVDVEQITARAGGGDLRLTGTADLAADPPMLDFRLQADSVRALDRSDAWLVGSGEFTLEGPLDRPLLAGEARIDRGAVREGEIGTDTHLDVDDPPHRELASRVPWPSGSRLRAAGPPEPLPLELDVLLTVDTVFDLWDEDSDLAGEGVIRLHTRDGELAASGRYEIVRGFYAFFGERFRVVGGAFRFTGDGIIPWMTLRGEHDEDEPLGQGRATSRTAADRRPLLEFFAVGSATDRRRFLRRSSLLPQTQTQLAQLLLFGVPPVPMEGWRQSLFWRASRAEALFGTRSETQAVSLLWSYTADEAYDYVPIDRGYLRGGTLLVGSRYPGRLVVGPLFRAGVSFSDRFEVLVLQPFRGGSGPGFRGRYRVSEGPGGTGELEVFNEPRYFSLRNAGAEVPGYYYRWRRGLTFRWWWTF